MDKQQKSQLLIIGDGPCGTSAAIYAAQADLDVTLLSPDTQTEKSHEKPLQSLYPDIEKLLGLISAKDALNSSKCGQYSGVSINDKFTPLSQYSDTADLGFHIDRNKFDNYLLTKANEAGVHIVNQRARHLIQVEERISAIILENGKTLNCDYIIDASGMNRFVGRRLELAEVNHSPELTVTTGVVEDANSTIDKNDFSFYTESLGWYWLIKGKNDTITWTKLSLKSNQDLAPPKVLKNHTPIGKTIAHNMTWRSFENTALSGALLAGDAANNIDPAAGQGVYSAVASGIKAAQIIISCVSKPEEEMAYFRNYHSWLENYFEVKCEQLKAYYQELNIELFD
ncbi:MAG: NAD(P)/FAD-dependent oxidoreductase [Lentisphaeraceae bacterium]|nr:NAD(P)/FAD-dependent oxidoreductase [Lentisphaeraceae bacterium]